MSILEQNILNRVENHVEKQLHKEELDCFHFLSTDAPEKLPLYLNAVRQGRQGILNRLTAALLREDIAGLSSASYDLRVIGAVYAMNIPHVDNDWSQLIQQIQTYPLKEGSAFKVYALFNGEYLLIPVSRMYAFRRLEITGTILYVNKNEIREVKDARDLLYFIRLKEGSSQAKHAWEKLIEELQNGSANLALSYTYFNEKKNRLRNFGYESAIDYVLQQKNQNESFDGSLFFEQLSVEGHNLHPGAKTKMGMKPEDVYRYAPEFEGVTNIRFVGIHREHAEWSLLQDRSNPNELLFKEFPAVEEAILKEFSEKNLNIDDYVVVPVHPWQYEYMLSTIYGEELKKQIVIPIEGALVSSGATSSFRTMIPFKEGRRNRIAVKAAVNSQMTSTVRSISANTTNNAVKMTELIKKVMKRESKLADTFVPIYEIAGYNFKASSSLKSRNLSAVLRENIENFVGKDETAIVGSALYAESPFTGKLVLIELIEAYAKELQETSLSKAAFQFLSQYARIAIPGFLTFMVKYGIGLEGHLQNSVPVFKNGKPVRVLFRDWGGVRIYGERLKKQDLSAQFYPGSVTVTDDVKEMQNKVFYTVFQNQFGELIFQLCHYFNLDEALFWKEIRRISDETFNHLAFNEEYNDAVLEDRGALYKETVEHKALTKMRLAPESQGYCYVSVPNPLSENY
ncbi:IucA/IucC family protein [Bacillus taeanensis]|uniref:IucA/IucC family protein n=1 Tax=Bacillus taeanensis TaxID=273032 RepID=A0A366XSW8_9BACI|nr:IucA/IucC family protein [Bacillus taeanensis]RBW68766.1 IucA/IucC family protein [Bacillus taeanensis]